jgi:formylglycine-generating enzyme
MKKLAIFLFQILIPLCVNAQNIPAIEVISIKGGTFIMGSDKNGAFDSEKPLHEVTLSDFSIGKYEVTVGQYKVYCEDTKVPMPEMPTWGWNDNYPMVFVTWQNANSFCTWLSKKTGQQYRLPSEAEWEFVARGGDAKPNLNSALIPLESPSSYEGDTEEDIHPVGQKQANALGVYDMTRNVWEWCLDWYDEKYYSISPKSNPINNVSSKKKVIRGGSWDDQSVFARMSFRFYGGDNDTLGYGVGFRVVMINDK